MYTVDVRSVVEFYDEFPPFIGEREVEAKALYLFPPVDRDRFIFYLDGIPELENLCPYRDRSKIEEILTQNPKRYIPLINAKFVESKTWIMCSELNEINEDMISPSNLSYRVIGETLDNIDEVLNACLDPVAVLVNIGVGLGYDPKVRDKVRDFAKQRGIPIIIYGPDGRNHEVVDNYDQIKEEWNAETGFVADDPFLSVAESILEPARDWLYTYLSIQRLERRFPKPNQIE